MLLRQLTLHNIRSYQQETLTFPSGSTLLSGDIGSGKSTILMAIEFALFGSSRSELPGEALLRQGATQGSVELHFHLDGKEIILQRALKKEKDMVKQLPGSLIVNNLKKELLPVELKAEVINLLGYPEDLLTKNKNYVFRYTVYCPQEEMKLILQEDAEIRLDTLRKIFNLDKYKNIRENLQIHLKQQRVGLAALESKIEPLEQHQQQLQQLEQEENSFQQKINELKPGLQVIQNQIKEQKQELQSLEEQQTVFLEIKNNHQNICALLQEKERQLQQLLQKRDQRQLQIQQFSFPEGLSKEQLSSDLGRLEEQKNNFISQRAAWQTKISQLQRQIEEKDNLIKQERTVLSTLPEKKALHQQLTEELSQKEILDEKISQLEELFQKMLELITKNETLLEHSKEMEKKIKNLETCPTCLQPISLEHRERIIQQEQDNIIQAEHLLLEARKKKQQISEQKEQLRQQQEQMNKKENLLSRLGLEISQLEKQQKQLSEDERAWRWLKEEQEQACLRLTVLESSTNLEQLQQQIFSKQDLVKRLLQKEIVQQNIIELAQQINQSQEQKNLLQEQRQQIEFTLAERVDGLEKIKQKKMELELTAEQERNLSLQLARLQAQVENLSKQKQQIGLVIRNLTEQKNLLLQNKEIYHWLENYFLPLTYTIEKQLLVAINLHFNRLFQEWFSMVIDDENISARIDDSFTPLIEQNGYEISFSNLSGGERTSAALAYRLALNKVINDVIPTIHTKELLILDEPTEGFSSEQLDKVREVLDKLQLRQIILVSHESKIETFVEKVIRISKEEQKSVVN